MDKQKHDSLRQDCQEAFNSKQVREQSDYSLGTTFFMRADKEPRCLLERMAQDVFQHHVKRLVG